MIFIVLFISDAVIEYYWRIINVYREIYLSKYFFLEDFIFSHYIYSVILI